MPRLEEFVVSSLSDVTLIPKEELRTNPELIGQGIMDSLQFYELVENIENEYDISLNIDLLIGCRNITEIVALIESEKNSFDEAVLA